MPVNLVPEIEFDIFLDASNTGNAAETKLEFLMFTESNIINCPAMSTSLTDSSDVLFTELDNSPTFLPNRDYIVIIVTDTLH